VYTVLDVSLSGKQEVLGLWIEETQGARFWLKVFKGLIFSLKLFPDTVQPLLQPRRLDPLKRLPIHDRRPLWDLAKS
jgi:hypothetical protein